MYVVKPFRFPDKPQINFVFLQKLQGMVGGLAFNSDLHMWVQLDEFLQIRKQHVFAEGSADPDM